MTAMQEVVCLARHPRGMPRAEDFALQRVPIPEPGPGGVLLRTLWLSLDPYLRPLLAGRYGRPPPAIGAVVPGSAVSQVVHSEDPHWPPGCLVVAETGWCEYALARSAELRPVLATGQPESTALGVLGIPGLTAWAGLRFVARPRAGETVLVSTAAGAVGSVAGQLARLAGCRVVGIAGSAEKCRIAVEEFGFADCISHRSDDLEAEVRAACPDGVDVYFDNVGVHVLAAALANLRPRARVVLCGLSGQYNAEVPPPGPHLGPVIRARARLEGLVVHDHLRHLPRFSADVSSRIARGEVRYREQVHAGIARAPEGFMALMRGENLGKALVRVASPSPAAGLRSAAYPRPRPGSSGTRTGRAGSGC